MLLVPKDVCKIVGDDGSSLRLLVVVGGKWEEALDLNQTNCPCGHLASSLNGLNRKWRGGGGGVMNWEIGIDMYTLICIK